MNSESDFYQGVEPEQDESSRKILQERPAAEPPSRSSVSGWKIFWGIVTGISILGNFALFMIVVGLLIFLSVGQKASFFEEVVEEGPRLNKILIINLEGVIDGRMSRDVCKQLSRAQKDRKIEGIIIRINSPGGMISSSDEIYNQIHKFRDETGRPVVAFMQGVAASGGYYASVGCEKIIAEPTCITGSIGVIIGYLVVEDLLEEKLGIQSVVIKSGEKKDWPSTFTSPTEEQLQYIREKLITPAYERFVEIVADNREGLTLRDVEDLADGSIFMAVEALNEKMIDGIGYLDEAIELVLNMAGIKDAQVIQYKKPFSFSELMRYCSPDVLKISKATIYELTTPEPLYLWREY
jgi:protease-4